MTTRSHKTRWTVRLADRIAALSITIGGIGTILAVTGVFLFLVSVVIPIFKSGQATSRAAVPIQGVAIARAVGVDEYRVCGWSLGDDGVWRAFRLDNGDTLATRALVARDSIAVSSFDAESGTLALGLTDGSIRMFRTAWDTDYPDTAVVRSVSSLAHAGAVMTLNGAVVQRTPEGSLRRQRAKLMRAGEIRSVAGGAPRAISHMADDKGFTIATLTGDSLVVDHVSRTENEFTGEASLSVKRAATAVPHDDAGARLLVAENGNAVYVLRAGGEAAGFDARSAELKPMAAARLTGDATLTAASMLIGHSTLLVGDSRGHVRSWFSIDDGDAKKLVSPRAFTGDGSAVRVVVASPRERLFLAGYASGRVRVFQATSGKRVADFMTDTKQPIDALAFAPKTDGIVVAAGGTLHHYDFDAGYPEVTLRSLFRPVWYEGYAGPTHVWQSSAGTDDFEAKLGMWPLVFGTLKATFYAMLFGVPLALLAAIYTSEFVSPSMRPRLKTLIESMASLPSVVLGFLAALVFAPFVQREVAAVMVGFVVTPFVLLCGAYLWQTLPAGVTRRYVRLRLPLAFALIPVAIAAAAGLGPVAEHFLFAGDVMGWLDHQRGTGFGGWVLLLIVPCAVAVIFAMGRLTGERIRRAAAASARERIAWLDLARFAAGTLATLVLTFLIAGLLSAVHLDPRGGLFATYVQRNALVVGFVMGFAIIPIIYTIAEDALSAVPAHLRAASLGAGATPWQTATRIVLPTAMSGLFSAVMIGLGRAVGETMIVLMAAGNTPILQMNIFNGFRTLSANIAVELPEAVRNSTHYRTLFLAALLLFAMTFVVNTVAEMVRLRFRRRSALI